MQWHFTLEGGPAALLCRVEDSRIVDGVWQWGCSALCSSLGEKWGFGLRRQQLLWVALGSQEHGWMHISEVVWWRE